MNSLLSFAAVAMSVCLTCGSVQAAAKPNKPAAKPEPVQFPLRCEATGEPSASRTQPVSPVIAACRGQWQAMVAGNLAVAKAAAPKTPQALQAWNYLMYGYLQLAKDNAAEELIRQLRQLTAVEATDLPTAYALAAIPARFALENENWAGATALAPFPTSVAWYKFPQAEAVTVYARALGAARSGKVELAKKDVQRLMTLRDELMAADDRYWSAQTDIQRQAVNAWIAYTDGRAEEAVRFLRAAAEAEAASDKHPVTAGGLLPMREQLGDLHLLLRQPAEAFAAYEQALQRDPNRFRSLYGAAHSAELLKDHAAAQTYYLKLVQLTEARDRGRPEISYARRYVRGEEPSAAP